MAEHIRIGDVAPRVSYVADGAQNAFVYPFPVFEADDVEVHQDGLEMPAGYAVSGAGSSDGGLITFALPPPAGARLIIRRRLVMERVTDYQPNGVLRANTLNDELDRQIAALQELREDLTGAVRLVPGEAGGRLELPLRAARANRILGFDSVGDITVFSRGEATLSAPFPGAIPRTVEDKLAERLSARDFGATGDGVADDGPALQSAMNAAAASGKFLDIGEGVFRTAIPLTLPGAAAGLSMRGTILYAGPDGRAALTLGDGGAARNQARRYEGIRVRRATISSWTDERDIGVVARNLDASVLDVRQIERFTIGLQTLGVELGFEDSTVYLGRLVDNRYGLDVRVSAASGWNNSVRYIGGHFANSSASHPTLSRYGVRMSRDPGGYTLHNAHLFEGPAFELQRQGTPGTVEAVPFLLEVDGRGLRANGVRMEACSPFVAKHTGSFNDAVYEVTYVGTYGFRGCSVLYAGSNRAGGTVLPLHQAAAAHGTPRLVASAENIRARAFRQTLVSTDGIGFEGMAVLSGNPSGPPTTLDGFCFPGLDQIALGAEEIGLPTSRALAFVVDASVCKEFFVAAEGTELRPIVQQFDAGQTVLTDTAPALLSNMNVLWSPGPVWWEGNANLDSLVGGLTLNGLQRVTLADACAFAVIGVRGGSATATLRALRLYTGHTAAPRLLYGNGRRWGVREYTARDAGWDIPAIAAGASLARDVAVPGARQGDTVHVGFAKTSGFQNGGVVFHGAVGGTAGTDMVRVTAHNVSAGSITVGAGTLFVRVVKPRA